MARVCTYLFSAVPTSCTNPPLTRVRGGSQGQRLAHRCAGSCGHLSSPQQTAPSPMQLLHPAPQDSPRPALPGFTSPVTKSSNPTTPASPAPRRPPTHAASRHPEGFSNGTSHLVTSRRTWPRSLRPALGTNPEFSDLGHQAWWAGCGLSPPPHSRGPAPRPGQQPFPVPPSRVRVSGLLPSPCHSITYASTPRASCIWSLRPCIPLTRLWGSSSSSNTRTRKQVMEETRGLGQGTPGSAVAPQGSPVSTAFPSVTTGTRL